MNWHTYSDVPWAWYLLVGSVSAVAGAATLAYYWSLNAWQSHPITKKLKAGIDIRKDI